MSSLRCCCVVLLLPLLLCLMLSMQLRLPHTLQPKELQGRLQAPATAGTGMDCYQQHGWDHLHGQMGIIKHLCMPDAKRRKKRLVAEAAAARAAGAPGGTGGPPPGAVSIFAPGSAPAALDAVATTAANDPGGGGEEEEEVEQPQWGGAEDEQHEEEDEADAQGGQGGAAALPGVSVLEWCLLRVSSRKRAALIRAVSAMLLVQLSLSTAAVAGRRAQWPVCKHVARGNASLVVCYPIACACRCALSWPMFVAVSSTCGCRPLGC